MTRARYRPLRSIALAVLIAGVASGAVAGCANLPIPGAPVACPAALAQGTLVAAGAALGLRGSNGRVEPIDWGTWYSVQARDGVLVLVDRSGKVRAREGDPVSFGGGVGADEVFRACGDDLTVGGLPD